MDFLDFLFRHFRSECAFCFIRLSMAVFDTLRSPALTLSFFSLAWWILNRKNHIHPYRPPDQYYVTFNCPFAPSIFYASEWSMNWPVQLIMTDLNDCFLLYITVFMCACTYGCSRYGDKRRFECEKDRSRFYVFSNAEWQIVVATETTLTL